MELKILETKILRGPNYWSCYRKNLIQMKVDLGEYEDWPTDTIEGFATRLEQAMPSLYEHRCSEEGAGGFFERVRKGTWLGHVTEHVALELQTLAGMNCGYGRTRSTREKGHYHVVFAYEIEEAGVYAGRAALETVEALATGQPVSVEKYVADLAAIKKEKGLGPSSKALYEAAVKRGIPARRLNGDSDILLGHGDKSKRICAALTDMSSAIAVDLVDDKVRTKQLLHDAGIPVPGGLVLSCIDDLEQAVHEIGFPLVIKPASGNHGRGVKTNIHDLQEAADAFHAAQKISSDVIVEKFIQGTDYRLLVVNYNLVAAAARIPASVTGDGRSTVSELVEQENRDPSRGNGHENFLTAITIDDTTTALLKKQGFAPDSIPSAKQRVLLKTTANISTGGKSKDVTDLVHQDIVTMAERAARLIGLDVCGIDLIAEDIGQPLKDMNVGILEINACPGLRMHLRPSEGEPRDVATPIINMLFPGGDGRIPLVAVTGSNGKTTVCRLTAYFATLAGYNTGFTSTDGIFLGGRQIREGDCSGPESAKMVLADRKTAFAVLECARGGILRSGLGFDHCSTSVVTNVTGDHLGLNDIHTLNDLAAVKSVVPRSTSKKGYAVLNADDDLVFAMRKDLDCHIALFSRDQDNQRLLNHCRKGGLIATIEDGNFIVRRGNLRTRIARVTEVPITMNGRAECMIQNVLAAVLAAIAENIPLPAIRKGLATFMPTAEQAPGRMNLFEFPDFTVVLDYAHNTAGMQMMKLFLEKTPASFKTGIIASPGDRRDEDIVDVGRYAATMFDEIIIRHDKDGRGRSDDEITRLLHSGIVEINPAAKIIVISDEKEALRYAMEHALPGAYIICCSDEIRGSIDFLKQVQADPTRLEPKIMEQNY